MTPTAYRYRMEHRRDPPPPPTDPIPVGTIHARPASLAPAAGALWSRAVTLARSLGVVAANGIRWLARSLAYHRPRGTLADGRLVVELCSGWVAQIPGVSSWAARTAWNELVRGRFPVLSSEALRAAGIAPRVAARHGQYLVIAPEERRALRAAAGDWGALGLLDPESLDDDPAWVEAQPGRSSARANGWLPVHCPYHEDRSPSAGVRWNSDGVTGGFHCFVCRRASGGGLSGIARFAGGKIEILRTDSDREPSSGGASDSVGRTGTSTFNTQGGRVGLPSAVSLRSDDLPTDSPEHRRYATRTRALPLGPYVAALRADERGRWESRIRALDEAGAAYDRAAGRVQRGALPDPRGWQGDALYTVDSEVPTAWSTRTTRGGRTWSEPTGWRSVEQRSVLFDLDNVEGLTLATARRAAEAIARVVGLAPEFSGAHMVVQTSYRGLQVLAELREPVAPGAFSRGARARWYLAVGYALLAAVRAAGAVGGELDPASASEGRLGRLPGPRLLKSGLPYVARLLGLALPAGALLGAGDARRLAAWRRSS